MSEEQTLRQESVEVRRRYVLSERQADHLIASVEFQFVREGSDSWRPSLVVSVPWAQLDLSMALTVCRWLTMVLQQELQDPPRTPEGGERA